MNEWNDDRAAPKKKRKSNSLADLILEYDSLYEPSDIPFNPPKASLIDERLRNELRQIIVRMGDGCPLCKRFPSPPECPRCHGRGGQAIDWWVLIVAPEGEGKSSLAIGILVEYCKLVKEITGITINFEEAAKKFIIFDDFDFMRVVMKLNSSTPYNFILADEGSSLWQNRESMSRTRRTSTKFINVMRFLKCFVVTCAVDIAQLDVVLKEHRIKSLIRIPHRGIYAYYNRDRLAKIYKRNKGNRSLTWSWRGIAPLFTGRFGWSEDLEKFLKALKIAYIKRFQLEAKRSYYKELISRLSIGKKINEGGSDEDA